ncbi:unnamed protein product [Cylicocyclus nassatus]|uniref:Uncharacterized protein n=1 Tax=Cylicocyclus nassatus TaxID=53992 RepID=A0AA36MBY4_CYLNA|nr:unnamed protein product [Cylicocyclus nassatus]
MFARGQDKVDGKCHFESIEQDFVTSVVWRIQAIYFSDFVFEMQIFFYIFLLCIYLIDVNAEQTIESDFPRPPRLDVFHSEQKAKDYIHYIRKRSSGELPMKRIID